MAKLDSINVTISRNWKFYPYFAFWWLKGFFTGKLDLNENDVKKIVNIKIS